MKTIHKLVFVTALMGVIGLVAFAAEKPAPKDRVLRIESGGQVIAEVRLLAPCKLLCGDKLTVSRDGTARYQPAKGPNLSGVLKFDNGAVLHFNGNVETTGKGEDLGLSVR